MRFPTKCLWLAALGCKGDEGESNLSSLSSLEVLPGIEDACIGTGEIDEDIDGTIDARSEHIIAERWERLSTWTEDYTLVEYHEVDERGDLIVESSDYYGSSGNSYSRWSAERDEQGRILVEIESQDMGFGFWTARTEHSYDGELLAYTELFAEDLYQVTTYAYDADGRLIETLIEPGSLGDGLPEIRTSTYLAPSPSLDARLTQDMDGDGSPEIESEVRFDEAGAMTSLAVRDHLFATAWNRVYEYDTRGYEIRQREEWEDPDEGGEVHKTFTTRDEQGRALHVEELHQRGEAPEFLFERTDSAWEGELLQYTETERWSEEALVSSSRTTWTWECP